eukprot:TRINITY_DN18690_c0_g2_i4.p1 TRINITY_DN18690_c0_g2~~TRINITY_DN18690_c0_g2_i4.p1  ORF type:complete len:226 (+),score=53.63 TRINITY_DN18690_c0_g2_i4:35-679(+)
MSKRPREDDPLGDEKEDVASNGTKDSLTEWLSGVLKNDEGAVSSFVNLRENREAMDASQKEQQYKSWLESISKEHPQPADSKAVSSMSLEEGKTLVKKCAMQLVDEVPLVAASFMFLDGSSHTNVNDWKAEEMEKCKEEDKQVAEQKADTEDTRNPRKRSKHARSSKSTKDLTMVVLCEKLEIKADTSDTSETLLTVYKDEVIHVAVWSVIFGR